MAQSGDYYSEFDTDKNTKLHRAAAINDIGGVVELLGAKCKVDPANCLGWTPLMMAARNGYFDVVKILIENKADATRKNAYGTSVFLVAIAGGDADIIFYLLDHLLSGGVSRQSMESIMSPFLPALIFQHNHLVQSLIAKSFNVNATMSVTGISPIMLSAMMGNNTIFNVLLANGADPTAKNVNKQSAYDIMNIKCGLPHIPHNFQEHQKLTVPQEFPQKKKESSSDQHQKHNRRHKSTSNDHSNKCHNQNDHPHHQFHSPQIQFFSPQFPSPVPIVYYSPQPVLIENPMTQQLPLPQTQHGDRRCRRSSNFTTPCFMVSPSLSPIVPQISYAPQAFFPPDFNANAYGVMSPYQSDNSLLNQKMYPLSASESWYNYCMPPSNVSDEVPFM